MLLTPLTPAARLSAAVAAASEAAGRGRSVMSPSGSVGVTVGTGSARFSAYIEAIKAAFFAEASLRIQLRHAVKRTRRFRV